MKMKIRRGDNVRVISGKDKGMQGEVLKVLPQRSAVVVKGVNLRHKHQRQVQAGGRTMNPGIIQFEAPISVSNVMLVCPSCKELSRIGINRVEGEAQRYCKKCKAVLDV